MEHRVQVKILFGEYNRCREFYMTMEVEASGRSEETQKDWVSKLIKGILCSFWVRHYEMRLESLRDSHIIKR